MNPRVDLTKYIGTGLGRALLNRTGAVFDSFRLERVGHNASANSAIWRVVVVAGSGSPEDPGYFLRKSDGAKSTALPASATEESGNPVASTG